MWSFDALGVNITRWITRNWASSLPMFSTWLSCSFSFEEYSYHPQFHFHSHFDLLNLIAQILFLDTQLTYVQVDYTWNNWNLMVGPKMPFWPSLNWFDLEDWAGELGLGNFPLAWVFLTKLVEPCWESTRWDMVCLSWPSMLIAHRYTSFICTRSWRTTWSWIGRRETHNELHFVPHLLLNHF